MYPSTYAGSSRSWQNFSTTPSQSILFNASFLKLRDCSGNFVKKSMNDYLPPTRPLSQYRHLTFLMMLVAACVDLKIVIRHHYSERRFFPAALALLRRFFGSVSVNLGLMFLIQRGHTAHIFDSLRLSGFHTAFWQQSKKSAISCKVWLGPSQVPQSQLLKVVCFLVFFWNTPFCCSSI